MVSGGKSLEILKSLLDDRPIRGEEPCKQVPLGHDQSKHHTAKGKAHTDSRIHGLLCPFGVSCSHILGNKGSHGLHKRTGDQHGEVYDFAGDPVAGGGIQSQPVDKSTQGQEGNLCQALLQGQREPHPQELPALRIKAEVLFPDGKGQVLFHQHYNGADNTDGLCKNRGQGGACRIHFEAGHQGPRKY